MTASFMVETFFTLIAGVPKTLSLMAISVAIGSVLALLVAALGEARNSIGASLSRAYVFVFRGTPLLVQIFIIYYGFGQFRSILDDLGIWWLFRDPFWCAVIALALNTAAYISEIIRGGLRSVPLQQIEAGRACGMSPFLLFRRIILPITIRNALPAYGNEIVLMVKATSLASIITVMETTGIAARLISDTYRPIEVFIVAGGIYLLINAVLIGIVMLIERHITPHLRVGR